MPPPGPVRPPGPVPPPGGMRPPAPPPGVGRPGPRLGRSQRWLIGGVIAAVLWLVAAALAVLGATLVITRAATPPGPASEADVFQQLWPGQLLFFAAGGLYNLGLGVVVITTILGLKAPPR